MRLYNPVDACFSQMPDITAFLESQPEFPPVPPQDQWDFFTITSPEDERFTYLKYELRRRAYYEDPTFADKLPADWRIKYPQWPGKSYISIPEEVRRRAQPEQFNLHTIVRLPNGVFAPYTNIPTNVLLFDRSGPTQDVWYYEQQLLEGRKNYTKTQPLQFEEFSACLGWWKQRDENDRAWKISAAELLASGCNLDRKNPRGKEDITHLPPEQIAADIAPKGTTDRGNS